MDLHLKPHGSNRRRSLVPTSDLLLIPHQRHAEHNKGRNSRRFSDSECVMESIHQLNQSSPHLTKSLPKIARDLEVDDRINTEKKCVHFDQSPAFEQKLMAGKLQLVNLTLKTKLHFAESNKDLNETSPKQAKGELKSPLNNESKEALDLLPRIEESDNDVFNEKKEDIAEYVISTFPPVGRDEIDKHRLLNLEAEENSKKQPHVYEEYLRKLYVQKKLLEKRKREEEQRMLRRRARRLQLLKLRSREAKEDDNNESETRPESSRKETVRRKKIIQSFRYSRALEEYYKGQLGTDILLLEDEYLFNLGGDEVVNGWLVKSVGPQVLNLNARTMPSCNPILLRLRQREANRRALQRSRLCKKYSNLSTNSSQKLSRSHDSLKSLSREQIGLNINVGGNLTSSGIDGQILSDIPELRIKKRQDNHGKLPKPSRKSNKTIGNLNDYNRSLG